MDPDTTNTTTEDTSNDTNTAINNEPDSSNNDTIQDESNENSLEDNSSDDTAQDDKTTQDDSSISQNEQKNEADITQKLNKLQQELQKKDEELGTYKKHLGVSNTLELEIKEKQTELNTLYTNAKQALDNKELTQEQYEQVLIYIGSENTMLQKKIDQLPILKSQESNIAYLESFTNKYKEQLSDPVSYKMAELILEAYDGADLDENFEKNYNKITSFVAEQRKEAVDTYIREQKAKAKNDQAKQKLGNGTGSTSGTAQGKFNSHSEWRSKDPEGYRKFINSL